MTNIRRHLARVVTQSGVASLRLLICISSIILVFGHALAVRLNASCTHNSFPTSPGWNAEPRSFDSVCRAYNRLSLLQGLSLVLWSAPKAAGQSPDDESGNYVLPEGSPGFYYGNSSASVTFDQHSLLLDGKRIMLFSGEFHPFRLPSTKLWRDVLEKFKANGFNGVSVYCHWGLSSPRNGVVRFTEHNDIVKFYEVAKEVGILVVQRPGPYINAEAAGGGLPGWTTNIPGLARTNASSYKGAWSPYITEFSRITAPYQYPDGPVIAVQSENEYTTSSWFPGLSEHMQDIIDTFRANGLTKIPTIHNDKGPDGQFSQYGLGKVDLYGWDGYPLGFDCDRPSIWKELATDADALHRRWNPAEPLALLEWQGGAFDFWSGNGYNNCYALINEQFTNVYYKNNYAAGVRLQNLYMTYGGTNWGNSQTHSIYSSYDYGAALREDRTQSPKMAEIKLQAYFLHASPSYLTSVRYGNGSLATGSTYSNSSEVYTTQLLDPISLTNFYVVRQTTNNKTTNTDFTLKVNTTLLGKIKIPRYSGKITLAGRESKILVSNYKFGSSKLVYSTAEILTWATFGDKDYLLVYALAGQSIELSLEVLTAGLEVAAAGCNCVVTKADNEVVVTASPSGLSSLEIGNTVIYIADKRTASGIWAPRLVQRELAGQYALTPDVPSVWVSGPYLVRTAWLEDETVHLKGDLNTTTTIDVWGAPQISSVTWNGKKVKVHRTKTGSLRGTVHFSLKNGAPDVPNLAELDWKCTESTPELASDFDDSNWTLADKTQTARPFKPYQGKFVLYAGEYGYHAGSWVWRGHFNNKTNASGVQLSVQTGFAGAMSAFLNGHFLGTAQGTAHSQDGIDILNVTYTFNPAHLVSGDNVLTIYHDSTGMNPDYNIDDEHKTPRGIRGYELISSTGGDFSQWRVAGNLGGEDAPDYVRGPYNEGGWWFERAGAHLPGYDDASWNTPCSPLSGRTTPGITVYRTTFSLDFPSHLDVPLAFDFELDKAAPHRVLIYVNGWQFGRFDSSLGPQTSFPVPEGIINHHGDNEVLIQLWALYEGGAKLKKLELNPRAIFSSTKPHIAGLVPAPGWEELRGPNSK